MDKKMNTTIDFEFYDGSKAKMTLTFYALYQLKAKNKALYGRYTKVMASTMGGNYDELEMLTILYAAYLCANPKDPMTEEEFLIKCGSDRVAIANAVGALINPKKA